MGGSHNTHRHACTHARTYITHTHTEEEEWPAFNVAAYALSMNRYKGQPSLSGLGLLLPHGPGVQQAPEFRRALHSVKSSTVTIVKLVIHSYTRKATHFHPKARTAHRDRDKPHRAPQSWTSTPRLYIQLPDLLLCHSVTPFLLTCHPDFPKLGI